MGYSEKDLERFRKNELASQDSTFCFECRMCGACCRKRSEPVVLTGPDASGSPKREVQLLLL